MITALLFLAISIPDPRLTPGALCTVSSVGFDGLRYPAAIPHCQRYVTTAMKKKVLAKYGVPWAQRGLYEVDHLVPLCLGGSNDLSNLWAESWPHAKRKDVLEKRLCAALRVGKITQAAAVEQIRGFR